MNGALKLIAVITMLIDHTGVIFFPTEISFRVVGRLALPVFAWCIAQGYRYTSNLEKYFYRLVLFAFISQIPYYLMFPARFNILFSFSASLLLLYLKDRYTRWVYLVLLPLLAIPLEYGIYAIVLVILFHEFDDKKRINAGAFITATMVYAVIYHSSLQLFSIAALPLIFYLKDVHIKFPRRIFYWFYPVHWVILIVLSMIL